MTFLIVTHTPHFQAGESIYAYGPYVKEMNLWIKKVEKLIIITPYYNDKEINAIQSPYSHDAIEIIPIPAISFVSFNEGLKAILNAPYIFFQIVKGIRKSNHVHLRCPGTIGLIGCIAQSLFPKKAKTAKYAGNWDPNARQPFSYRLQKKWLSNTFLTKNMKVLVYGEWQKQSNNIYPFFTASYYKHQIPQNIEKDYAKELKFLFVGNLSTGKRPLYAIKLVEEIRNRGFSVSLQLFGEGIERAKLENYISENEITSFVHLLGNKPSDVIKNAYKESHFLILPSKSEGWPKVVAEAMFFGAIPIVTKISCVPWMLAEGERGILIDMDLSRDVEKVISILNDAQHLKKMATAGQLWSQYYTLDYFEQEIQKLLK